MSLIPPNSSLHQSLNHLAKTKQMVFLAGLPGTGKSLLLQQLAGMAGALGRQVHLLQWDVCRQPFESHIYVKTHYPEIDGVTHNGVRKGVGIWAREAVFNWYARYQEGTDILIGETPLIGNRLVELVRCEDDKAESVFRDETTTYFIVPTPSQEVKRLIEGQREERSARPLHEREKGDAQPHIMLAAWSEFCSVAHQFNLISADEIGEKLVDYDPDLYFDIYDILLKHRPHSRISMDVILATENKSVYDLNVDQIDLVPTSDEVQRALNEMEHRYSDGKTLANEIDHWYVV